MLPGREAVELGEGSAVGMEMTKATTMMVNQT